MRWLSCGAIYSAVTGVATLAAPGRFRYTNQDHSLEMGIMASKRILEGYEYDYDAVGLENEYFERRFSQ